ncbi:tape measure protein [Thauera phenylacetica]|uniref:tape measure protein n=1 Tax=Thauera phenylacetica TaxID=164400 RepID=UPI0039E50D63
MARSFELKAIISAVDKLSPTLKSIQRATRATRKSIMDIGGASRQLTGTIGGIVAPLGGVLGALGIGGIGGVAAGVVTTSAEFEKFRTILETIEGSAEKARSSMGWVSDFAAKTPYELNQVTEAFVKLKSYGIDPQAGALAAAGDAAAAMGKPLEQAVEALADAMTGENERLKEFGIKASKAGGMITYTWTQNGKKMAAKAKESSSAQIQAVIQGIWNSRYGGAMDKLSGTWDGMWSNIKDSVARFALQIGDAGLFPFLKGELQGVLDTLNRMAADGSLQKMATMISDELVAAFKELKAWAMSVDWKSVWQDVKDVVSGFRDVIAAIGGIKGVVIGFAVLLGAQVLAPIVLMTSAIGKLGIAYGTLALQALAPVVPLGTLTAAMSTATTAALALLAPLAKVAAAGAVGYGIGTLLNDNVINPVVQKLTGDKNASLGTWLYDKIHGDEGAMQAQVTPRAPARNLAAAGTQRLNGEIAVRFDNAPPGMRVLQGRTNQSGVSFNPDVGYSTVAMGLP